MLPRRARALALVVCFAVILPAMSSAKSRRRAAKAPARGQVQARKVRTVERPSVSRRHRQRTRTRRPVPRPVSPRGSVEEHVHLRRGDTLEGLLAARGMSVAEAQPWFDAAAEVYDLRTVQPRHGVSLRFDRSTRDLEAIRYEIDEHTLLVVEASADGIEAHREALPYFTEVKGVAGHIERGLRDDALAAGVPESVVANLGGIFGWDVDVENGLAAGDEFRVLYENIWEAGRERPQAGTVIGASLVTRGEAMTAIYFEDEDGRGAYYRPAGDAVSRALLRYPVDFTEVTSEFSLSRFHPILHRGRPHFGVDFAAPSGTPVRAAATGTVGHVGWMRGLGRSIRIDHTDGLTSVYGHLSETAPRLLEGAAVERGQVIGWVGASGLATGPHLHYALERDGGYVDPSSIDPAPDRSIAPKARRVFDRVQREVVHQLAALPATSEPQTVSLSRVAFPSPADATE